MAAKRQPIRLSGIGGSRGQRLVRFVTHHQLSHIIGNGILRDAVFIKAVSIYSPGEDAAGAVFSGNINKELWLIRRIMVNFTG